MAAKCVARAALFASLALAEDATLGPALAADDACGAGNEECSVELRQLRGEVNSAQAIIAKQMEDNKKYEVALDDDSGKVCAAPKGWKTTGVSCGGDTKCCTSQPSYLAGTAHSTQAHLSLYSICCPLDTHCKYDTIFVSCAGGPGPDDYSGVIAGLQEDSHTSEQTANDAEENVAEEDTHEVRVHDSHNEESLADEENEEDAAKEDAGAGDDAEVTGGKCMNNHDLKVWKGGGKQQYDAALDHCGTSCAAGFPCTKACMQKHGYSTGCASCMAHAVECGRDHCLSQCISNHKSKGCLHCNKKQCRPVMKRCSGWAVGGH